MVVSKDNKRRRKETDTPPTSSSVAAAATLAVESSPEMPKRTKVQAQRKFAQGQSAPNAGGAFSVANVAAVAPGSSSSGPSTSTDSQQPPIEILPNQRPKPQDFLTFLCFRSFQGKPKANDTTPASSDAVNNNTNKRNSSSSKKKRGRPAKKAGVEQQQLMPETNNTASDKIKSTKSPTTSTPPPPPLLLAGAVRKRAEVVAGGNRRGGRRQEALKRRSNRAGGTKGKDDEPEEQDQSPQEQNNDGEDPVEEEEDEDEFFSANDASSRNGGAADETLSKSETTLSNARRGRGKKTAAVVDSPAAVTENSAGKEKEKEKGPVKRLRQQRESPIFIPSPESSGRMTRQRAFFEPVKVPPKQDHDLEEQQVDERQEKEKELKQEQERKQKAAIETKPQQLIKEKTNSSIYAKDAIKLENGGTTAAAAAAADQQKSLNVFDFSSDDEQPLAKAIKLKKGGRKGNGGAGATAAVTANARGRKSAGGSAKRQQQRGEENEKAKVTAAADTVSVTPPSKSEEPSKAKRGKALKKKAESFNAGNKNAAEEAEHEPELSPPSPKKPTNNSNITARPARRLKVQQRSPSPGPQRSQRPSRKTKEAAAIYMGIIGHKLQMADDEDDDLSLDSFPDIPNVKQMEKMEKEIKKNAAGKTSNAELKKTSTKPTPTTTTRTTATEVAEGSGVADAGRLNAAAAVEPPTETSATAAATPPAPPPAPAPRRGRPPKQAKGASGAGGSAGAAAATVKPQIEGMLVKKGALALAKAKSEQQQQQQQQQQQKVDSDAEEDFLINEELNETKRKLEKSFSDSDDEPLAIKVPTAGSTTAVTTTTTTTINTAKASSSKTETPTTTVISTATTAVTITTATATVSPPTTTVAASTAAAAAGAAIAATLKPPQLSAATATPITPLTMLPLTTKPSPFSISPPSYASAAATLKAMEKKSPVPTSKILNVPATYALPGAGVSSGIVVGLGVGTVGFGKSTSYLPQASPHYQSPYVRPPTFCAAAGAAAAIGNKTPHPQQQQQQQLLATATTTTSQTSPLKYQTAPTIYPPPIEAYQCPKINPNFLTPKYDRASILPRVNNNNNAVISNTSSNNFTAPTISRPTLSSLTTPTTTVAAAAVKTTPTVSQSLSLSINPSTPAVASTSAAAAAASAAAAVQQQQQQQQQQQLNQPHPQQQSPALTMTPTTSTNNNSDPLKDEIGSILAQATLMPSKEESGKIFGIASVSLAQSSGPDNTKCTLGKCGSIHKPVLGPVVPTEAYFGDQLSGKERRKAKVNMTHEQIQKWLIECSSNPDEIQDDLDDEYDDSLRPQQSQTPPGPTRDDKESTSFSSSSKNTRGELGKSESAWSAKGPSLKATPVLVSTAAAAAATAAAAAAAANRREVDTESDTMDFDKCVAPVNLTQKKDVAAAGANDKRKPKNAVKASAATVAAAATASNNNKRGPTAANKRIAATAATKLSTPTPTNSSSNTPTSATATTTTMTTTTMPPKRTPIYQSPNKSKAQTQLDNKKQQQQHKLPAKTSVYAFGKDEEATTTATKTAVAVTKSTTATVAAGNKATTTNRRRNAEVEATTTAATPPQALSERSPTKKRAAATAAATAVQLTLSPTDKLEKPKAAAAAARKKQQQQQQQQKQQQYKEQQQQKEQKNKEQKEHQQKNTAATEAVAIAGGDSDADGATFYIPLRQGASSGDGGIQGVAVKLGREGPDGPNQKVVMQATLVTKAQMDTNSNKPMPDNELVKTLLNAANTNSEPPTPSNNSLKASTSAAAAAGAGAGATTSGSLVRVNSNSSLFSGSAKSRTAAASAAAANALAKKYKDDTPIKMANNTAFPRHDDPTQMVEAPIFKPTEKEFADPIEFIERITPIAARFGICKIIPPASFKPECRISDEMRFTAYNQYVHKMLHRWGPSAKELSAIKKYLATQSIVMNHAPWIGGMEVDLPRLYHTVQELGGLKEVIEKKKWARVAEEMCIPKLAQDRVTKLDDIYCKYLLPYDTLSPAERQKLFDEVEADWAKREARARRNADRFVNSTESVSNVEDDVSTDEDDESEEELDGVSMECIVKGRSMPLSQFYRIARNTMALWFKSTDPTVNEVEAEFWRHVAVRDSHVCVHSGSIDSSGWGYGFPSPGPKGKGSNYARHPWNLKVLTNNSGSVLRSLGPVMGVTVPTLHVGMLFSACCWYRDPHGLSWIEYLHTGASKLWYGIPDDQSANFRSALTSLIPTHCQNKTIWLPCDTVMVPPHMLTDRGVSLCRIEQKPGEFIVVFPRAYTSSLATGYVVSESVYFATNSWLDLAKDDFRDIHESCEPAMFSLEQLLFALGYDQRVNSDTLHQMLPMLNDVCEKESAAREQLRAAGVTASEKVQAEKGQKTKKQQQPPQKSIDSECDLCRANLYISMVRTEDGNIFCLQHALKNINSGNVQPKMCKLVYAYNVDDVQQLIRQLQDKINQIHHKAAVKKK